MAEQWPFKPLVKSSTLFALTRALLYGGLFVWFRVPAGGWYSTLFALTRAFLHGGLFVWLRVPTGGMVFDPLRAHKSPPSWRAFCLVTSPRRDEAPVHVVCLTNRNFEKSLTGLKKWIFDEKPKQFDNDHAHCSPSNGLFY